LAEFGANGCVLVMGRTNADLSRFGWLLSELRRSERMAGSAAK